MQAIYFDMDGTIADLYGYDNWLELLRSEDTTPYQECSCLVDEDALRDVLLQFIDLGITIGIISWGAKDGSREYVRRIRKAKIDWCEKYFPGVFTEYHVVKYGTPKHQVRKIEDSILFDDNEDIIQEWRDSNNEVLSAFPPKNLIWKLLALLDCEKDKQKKKIAHCNSRTKKQMAKEEKLYSPLWNEDYYQAPVLYLIGQSSRNPITDEPRYWIKVGLTKNISSRVNQYLTHCADNYFIEWREMSPGYLLKTYESLCHQELEKIALTKRTEWLMVPEKEYFKICNEGFNYFKTLE